MNRLLNVFLIGLICFYLVGCNLPEKPGRIWVEEVTQNLAVIKWDAPKDPNSQVYCYEYQTKPNSDLFWGPLSRVYPPIAAMKGLESNTSYDFRVRSIDLNGRHSQWKYGPGNMLYSFLMTRSSSMDIPSVDPRKNDFYFSDGLSSSKETELGNRIPIILVHGMSSEGRTESLNYWYFWISNYFNNDKYAGLFKVYRYVYNSSDYILNNGVAFAEFVNSYTELRDKQFIIIAHSMGGLVSRCAMNVSPNFSHRVIKLITLGTPHMGSPGANPTWFYHCVEGKWTEWWSHFVMEMGFDSLSKGCFDLAWYNNQDFPLGVFDHREEILNTFPCRSDFLDESVNDPFTGKDIMRSPVNDSKILAFGGYLGRSIQTGMGDEDIFKDTSLRSEFVPSGLSNHLALFIAKNQMDNIYKNDGSYFSENDGLVPLESALYKVNEIDSVDITEKLDEYVDHASLLDNSAIMDFIMSYIWEIIIIPMEK